jgi:hypothetical protein
MRTLVISDLHLGLRTEADVLRRPAAREALTARLADVDRLVLLGDTLELRHGPVRDALRAAEPAMRAIGDALPTGARVVLVPGNHDHALAAGWHEARERTKAPPPLGLEQRTTPRRASHAAAALARALAPAEVEVAYPGVWLRDDVYATHGHYLDAHGTIPTFERLAAGLMSRLSGAVPATGAAPDDYEAVLAPIYAWIDSAAQRARPGRAAAGSGQAVKLWKALAGEGQRPLRARALGAAFPLAILAVNRAGLGPVRPDLRGPELRRSALVAMGEAAGRLGLAPAHLVFGHTHRTGSLPGDDPAEWRTPAGTLLHNTGNWVFETHFMGSGGPGSSPYWPGGAIALHADGPPRLERLLTDVPEADLRPGRRP